MAMAGEGGFSTSPMGFNKGEVNEYIGNLRKQMKEMEAEKKVNDEKTKAAVKTAEEAEAKIAAAQKAGEEKIAELEAQVKTERRNSENLTDQIDDLKRKLKNAGASGKADTHAAERQSADIIAKANATARDIVEKAKQTAHEIISGAQGAGGGSGNLEEFMGVLRGYLETVSSGFKTVNDKASELLGASAPAVNIPDFSSIAAPAAPVHAAFADAETPGFGFDEITDDDNKDSLSELNSGASDDIFGAFDLSAGSQNIDEPVSDVAPIDTENHGKATFDEDFTTNLIAQTVPSSSLLNDANEELLAAVRAQEEKFAVQPSDGMDDFNMTDSNNDPSDGADAMRRMMEAAEAAFGGGSSMEVAEPEPYSSGSNPWEDMQKQLDQMQQMGNFGAGDTSGAAEPITNIADDPQTPNADDSSIWNFGSMDSGDSSDDDMSSDLFGSF